MTDLQLGLTFVVALAFAGVHLLGRTASHLRAASRSVWLSAAGGISVAYVFIHILPELDRHQDELNVRGGSLRLLDASGRHVYFVALVGLAAFYGLELLGRSAAGRRESRNGGHRSARGAFWLHLGCYAAFNVVIGYLLLHRDDPDLQGLIAYAVAMAMHFLVADQGLRRQLGEAYDGIGRWILAAAPVLGWGLGVAVDVPPLAISASFAFLAGGIVLTVLKEEMPEQRHSNFAAFALGAGWYAALLLATE
jgi:hypothetical protein